MNKVPKGVKEIWEIREKLMEEAKSLDKASKVEDYVEFLKEKVAKYHKEGTAVFQGVVTKK